MGREHLPTYNQSWCKLAYPWYSDEVFNTQAIPNPTEAIYLCAAAVVVAVFISLIPRIFPNLESNAAKHEEGGATGVAGVFWPLCIGFSEVPFAIGASCLELGLKHNQH